MRKIYVNNWFSLVIGLTMAFLWPTVSGEPYLNLVYSPDSLSFSGTEPLKSSSLADFMSLSLGYSLPKPLEWKGLAAIKDVFSLPKAVITIEINGPINIHPMYKFPILKTQTLDNEFDILSERTEKRFPETDRIVLKVDSSQKSLNQINSNLFLGEDLPKNIDQIMSSVEPLFQELLANNKLDKSDPNIRGFILEVETIRQTLQSLKNLKASKGLPLKTILWFDVKYFGQLLMDENTNPSVKDMAQKLISNLIEKLNHELQDLFDDRVLIVVIDNQPVSPVLVRKAREASATTANKDNPTDSSVLNLAHNYDYNFHTAFAMIGFTTLLIALSVFGISVSMWNLDPGKDSIIYRMTSQRIKKDQ